jgi:hypothetical protein
MRFAYCTPTKGARQGRAARSILPSMVPAKGNETTLTSKGRVLSWVTAAKPFHLRQRQVHPVTGAVRGAHTVLPGPVAWGPLRPGRHHLTFLNRHELTKELERRHHDEKPWLRACSLDGNRFKRRHIGANANSRTEDLDPPRRFQRRLCVSGGGRVSGAGGGFRPAGWRKIDRSACGASSRPPRPAFEPDDLVALRRNGSPQISHFFKQLQHQALQIAQRKIIKVCRRHHSQNESDSCRPGNLIIVPPRLLPLLQNRGLFGHLNLLRN